MSVKKTKKQKQKQKQKPKPVHSPTGASSMYRWAECPGQIALAAKAPKPKPSEYAQLGIAAHSVAEKCLKAGKPATYYKHHKLKELEGCEDLTIDGVVDDEMCEAVQVYLDKINEILEPGDETWVEHKFDLSDEMAPGVYGTSDKVIYKPKSKTLYVIDYKHGAGIPVNVKNNSQLKYYGLGATVSLGLPCDKVILMIIQPRCFHADGPIRMWETDSMALLDFSAELIEAIEATKKPDAPLKAGDHCRFCAAAPICPKLQDKTLEIAKDEFTVISQENYDPQTIAERMKWFPILKNYMEAVSAFAFSEAQAGRVIPGYKLVARRKTRKWKPDFSVDKLGVQLGMEPSVFYNKTMKSPAQVEKINKMAKTFIPDYVISESSGNTLVPEHDKRPAITNGVDEFELEDMLS